MFEQSILNTRERGRKPLTLAMSAALQCGVVGAMVLAPLAFTDKLPLKGDWAPRPPLRAPRAMPIFREGDPIRRGVVPPVVRPHVLYAPTTIRPLTMVVDPPVTDVSWDPGLPGIEVPGFPPGLERPIAAGTFRPPVTPPPEPRTVPSAPKPAPPPAPIRVSSGVQHAKLIRQPKPDYPELAKRMRVQGMVRLQGVIGRDGTIQQLQVISGHPWLVQAAVEAVRQWVYHPTLLSGEAVEVIAPIDVNFVLQ